MITMELLIGGISEPEKLLRELKYHLIYLTFNYI